jgi:hypothetical protein
MSDHEISDLKNKISVEIVKLVRTHLNNAQIEGIITAEIRDHLLHDHITELKQMEQGLKRKELLERLQELETMQDQLVHAYHESLGQLHTNIQNARSLSTPNEPTIQKNAIHIPQNPSVLSEPKPTRARKYLLSAVVISALTAIGIRFGMTLFMATGSLMIGGTLLVRFIKR